MYGLQPQDKNTFIIKDISFHSPPPNADPPEKPDIMLLPPNAGGFPLFDAKDFFAPVTDAKDFPVKNDLTLEMDLGVRRYDVQFSVSNAE